MKICYVSSTGIFDQSLYDKFIEKGWEVHVVVLDRSRAKQMEGLTFHYLLSGVSGYLLSRLPRIAKYAVFSVEAAKDYFLLKALLRKIKPDILHGTHVQSTGFLCALTGYRPFLLVPFGSDILRNPKKSKIHRMITEYTLKRAGMIACDAESVKREIVRLADYPEERICVFPFGIDLNKFNPNADGNKIREKLGWKDKKIVIMTRSFSPVYGVEYFLRGIPDIIANVPEARIILCGSGLLEDEFKGFIDREGLNTYVYFAGFVRNEEMPDYLTAADVYVSSSLSDGTSSSLLEAQACGLPVVVTDVAANQEWVVDGVNGFIAPISDSHKLTEKVIELLKDEGLRKRFSSENIRIAQERANWDRNFEKFERIYRELIDRRVGR